MLDLEDNAPSVHSAFMEGQFSINRTGNVFAGVATDQVLEQTMNRDSKGAGGLRGISGDEDAKMKWFLTSHIRAHLYAAQRNVCGMTAQDSYLHKEDTESTTSKDEADVQALLNILDQANISLYRPGDNLVNLMTGARPGQETTQQIL